MFRTNYVCFCKYSFIILLAVASVLTSPQGHVLEFTVEPTDTVVEAGQKAVLDCVVKASIHQDSVLIEWLDQDGQKITFIGDSYRSQLTNGSLYINNVIEEQRLTGNYQCMASLPNVGKIISRIAKLSIANLTGFINEPSDITVYIGQTAHFPCRAQASPPPKIRWLKDERPLQIDELRMTVLPSGALEIDEAVESDQGSYRCNASSLNSYKISNKANLIVNVDQEQTIHASPPNFIAKPRSEVVVEGQNISLNCAANGNPRPAISWLKDGAPIDMNYLDSRFSLVGSTKSLRITKIEEQDAGVYLCRAQNREDSLDAPAEITVQVPPKFLKKPQDKTEFANKDIEFECSVYGIPEPRIQWFKNGEVLTTNEYYQLVNGYNLKIMGLMSTDSALFQCFASNPAGNIQAAANLKVLAAEKRTKPNKTKKYTNSRRSEELKPFNKSQSMRLFSSLKSESSAKLGDVDFAHLVTSKSYLQHDSVLNTNPNSPFDPHTAFTSLKSDNDNVNNKLGDVLSAYSPTSSYPQLLAESSETGVKEGLPGPPQDVKATITKARFIILSWKPPLNNSENIETYSVYYKQEGSERERVQNTTKSRLEDINIGSLQPGRVYHFRVVAINDLGPGVSSERLTITTQSEEHVPSPPQKFTAYATSIRSIHVSWKPPDIPNGEILRYVVYYMDTRSSIEHNVETTELKYDLFGLSIFTEYSIWVVAVNKNGPGTATNEKTIRTYSAPPSEPPYNVTLEPSSSTSITVRWEPPPLESCNGIITGYKLRFRKHGKKGVTITTPPSERMYVLDELERASTYQVKLWAINTNGTSPGTEWQDIETYENDLDESQVPDKPGPLRIRPASDELYVMWSPPANQNIKIRNYVLGWGKGIPDIFQQNLDAETRSYVIKRLEPNSEYVLSLRATNEMGAGLPVYNTVRTQEEQPPEPSPPLTPPMGLKALVIGSTSVVLYWTDTTLKSQVVTDNRYYQVKYTAEHSQRSRYLNVTVLNILIDDLKPNTMYEFSVKLIKGRKESLWSMIVTNTTFDVAPSSAPRDLDVHLQENNPLLVELTWQPPRVSTSRITGYIILYTDDKSKSDRDWLVQAIKGDKHSAIFTNLLPSTDYYFKVQARNSKGNGPYSNIVMFTTGKSNGALASIKGQPLDRGILSGKMLLYLVIAACILVTVTISIVVTVLCCRRRTATASPDRSKKGYQKGTQNIKPPDLWIHHDQMELKAMEKSHSNNDGASSSGAMTLPRSVGGNDYEPHNNIHTNSLDKRTYTANSYVGISSPDDKNKRPVKSKPIKIPVDSKPPREPIATPINTTSLSQSSSDSTPSSRPPYPRTTYSMPRAHVTIDNPIPQPQESPYSSHPPTVTSYDGPNSGYTNPPSVAHLPPGSAYAPGLSVLAESQGGKRLPGQGHPLKSFTVPAPPPISAPGTPQPKHIVTVRPNSSPYKKAPTSSSSTLTSTPPSRISTSNPPPHTADELQKLQPSHSTEELNQEMANLEGLMLTLNAITANEFEC